MAWGAKHSEVKLRARREIMVGKMTIISFLDQKEQRCSPSERVISFGLARLLSSWNFEKYFLNFPTEFIYIKIINVRTHTTQTSKDKVVVCARAAV